MVGQPSSRTSYVVLGADAGPSKLAAIKKNGLRTLDEDGFLNLIATRVPDVGADPKLAKKLAKEQDAIRAAAHEMERREQKAESTSTSKGKGKDKAAGDGARKAPVPLSSQLWTDRYAPRTLKEICGNKGQVEKLQLWLHDWCVPLSVIPVAISLLMTRVQVGEPEGGVQEAGQERHEHVARGAHHGPAGHREDDERAPGREARGVHADRAQRERCAEQEAR